MDVFTGDLGVMIVSEYIKREDAYREIMECFKNSEMPEEWENGMHTAGMIVLQDVPSADVEPVRHGRWEDFEQHSWSVNLARRCQICGWLVTYTQSIAFAYCPNCGARMDSESDE